MNPRFAPRGSIDLGEPDAAAEPPLETARMSRLRLAVVPVVSPERSVEMCRRLAVYLARKVGRRPVFLQRSTYIEVNELVRYGMCDLALV